MRHVGREDPKLSTVIAIVFHS